MTTTETTATIFNREQAKAADKNLYDAYMEKARKDQRVVWALSSIDSAAGRRRKGYSSNSPWNMTADEALARVQVLADTDTTYIGRQAADALAKLAEARAEVAAAKAAIVEADKWADHGMWNRFSLVPGGHIHNDLDNCKSFRYDYETGLRSTDVRWAHLVSGDSVDEAIETYGDALCTHCFPNAPVARCASKVEMDANGDPMTKAAADAIRQAKADEKAAKLAAKNAKRVIDSETGEDVQDEDQRPLKTEVAVRNEILRLLDYGNLDRITWAAERKGMTTTRGEVIANLVRCLAEKRGVDAAELRAEFDAKAAKKRR